MADDRDDAALRAKLDALKGALAKERAAAGVDVDPAAAARREAQSREAAAAMSLGLKAASEFIAAVLVGAAIGWGLDRLTGLKPLFLILFFLLGVAAGVWNVIRAASPKDAGGGRNSRLSRAGAPDKDGRRAAERGAGANVRARDAGGQDDDED